jgi:hypothetical protein
LLQPFIRIVPSIGRVHGSFHPDGVGLVSHHHHRCHPALVAAIFSAAALHAASAFGDTAFIRKTSPIATHPASTGLVVAAFKMLHHPSFGSTLSQPISIHPEIPETRLIRLSS